MKYLKLFEEIEKSIGENNPNLPKLKYEIESVVKIQYNDLERFIKRVYDLDFHYSIPEALQCGNDSSHEIYVDSEEFEDEDDIINFINGEYRDLYLSTILNDLAKKKLIPDKATYIIRVCW
jgi:hypothetical protein